MFIPCFSKLFVDSSITRLIITVFVILFSPLAIISSQSLPLIWLFLILSIWSVLIIILLYFLISQVAAENSERSKIEKQRLENDRRKILEPRIPLLKSIYDSKRTVVAALEKDKTLTNEDRVYLWDAFSAQIFATNKTNPFSVEPLHLFVGKNNLDYEVVGIGYADLQEFNDDIDKLIFQVPEELVFHPDLNKQIEFNPLS